MHATLEARLLATLAFGTAFMVRLLLDVSSGILKSLRMSVDSGYNDSRQNFQVRQVR